jgi:hypothetical protein
LGSLQQTAFVLLVVTIVSGRSIALVEVLLKQQQAADGQLAELRFGSEDYK